MIAFIQHFEKTKFGESGEQICGCQGSGVGEEHMREKECDYKGQNEVPLW